MTRADRERDILIRRATTADWPAIAALLTESALPLDGAREHLEAYFVAVEKDALVGVVGIESYGDVGLLRSLAVIDPQRRSGLGSRMIDALLGDAKSSGTRTIFLLTTTAAPFFARRGFSAVVRSAAPRVLQASAEFRGACPASAALMRRDLV